ncbi:hypothetical protein Tco_0436183 [Tanacetum coccineum]
MPPRHHHSLSPRQPPDLPQPIPPHHCHSLTTVTFVLSAIAAAVVGCGWRIGHHSHDEPPIEPPNILVFLPRDVHRQTTIVVAVGRRYSHHSRTLWCRAVMAQPHGMSRVVYCLLLDGWNADMRRSGDLVNLAHREICSKHMTGNLKPLKIFVEKFMGTIRFGNDQFEAIT